MSIYGHIDGIKPGIISGWVVNRLNLDVRCIVIASYEGKIIAEVEANRFRDDLKGQGIGDGRYAFEIQLPNEAIGNGAIQVTEKYTGMALIGSPVVQKEDVEKKQISRASAGVDSIFAELGIESSILRASETDYSNEEKGGHYDRISKLIAEKSAAEVLTFELARLAGMLETQDRELRQIRALLALQSAVLNAPEQSRAILPEKVDIRADAFISDLKGFYGLEWHRDDNYRWTGPERAAVLDAFVARHTPVSVNLILLKMRPDGRDDQCRIIIDGQYVPMQVQAKGNFILYRAALPPSAAGQKTQICILSPELFCPGGNDSLESDRRQLGVAFHRLVVHPASSIQADNRKETRNA